MYRPYAIPRITNVKQIVDRNPDTSPVWHLVCFQRDTKLTQVPVRFLGIHLTNHTLKTQ